MMSMSVIERLPFRRANHARWTVEVINRRDRRWEQDGRSHRDLGEAICHAYRIIDSGNRWVRIFDNDQQQTAFRTRRILVPEDNGPYQIIIGGRPVNVQRFDPPLREAHIALVRT